MTQSLFLAKFEIVAKGLNRLVCDRELEFLFKAHACPECPDRSSRWRICSRSESLFPDVSAVIGFFNTLRKLVPQLPCLTELDLAGAMSEEARFRSQFQRHFNLRHGTEAPGQQEPVGEAPHMLVDKA